MKSRIARFAVLFLPVFAVMAGMPSPAEARNAGVVAVTGVAKVGQGLGYPCVGKLSTPDQSKCPVVGSSNLNSPGVDFKGSGTGFVTKVNKPKCNAAHCAEIGTFDIEATGTVTGWCGLSTGTLGGTIKPAANIGTKANNNRSFNINFVGVGGMLVVTGTTLPQNENIAGTVVAVPDLTKGYTCTNKNPKDFLVAGEIIIAR